MARLTVCLRRSSPGRLCEHQVMLQTSLSEPRVSEPQLAGSQQATCQMGQRQVAQSQISRIRSRAP